MIDGKAVVSCQYDVAKAEGKSIVTLEGVDEAERQCFSDAFAACGGLQCGFCIPGIVMRAKAQIDKKGTSLTKAGMAPHLGAHLCRCTGYVKILDAIDAVAQGKTFEPALVGDRRRLGSEVRSGPLTLGDRGYIDDIRIPGMLHAALHLTDHARADIVAIDPTAALAAPGVEAVFTAADLPGELRVGIIYKDWPVLIPVGGRTSYAGDVLAIVVADTRDHARAAAKLVEVTYDVLPPNTDPVAALVPTRRCRCGAPSRTSCRPAPTRAAPTSPKRSRRVHSPSPSRSTRSASSTRSSNPSRRWPCPPARATTRSLHVYSGGQGVWDDRDDIARVLAIDTTQVTVELVSNGGAFGGKEDMSNQAQASLAAWLLDRPVKCTLSREESLRMHAKRHPIHFDYEAGCDADGRLTALRVRGIGDSGAYASVGMKVLERAAGHACGAYRWQALDIETVAVRTNNLVCGAFRGFGANQAQFALEGVLDRLAEQVGISGWEIRKRNVIQPGRRVGSRPDHGRRLGRCRGVPRRDQGRVRRGRRRRQGGRARARPEELRARQRVPRGVAGGDPLPSGRRRRSPVASRFVTAGPRWARASTPSRCRSRPKRSSIDPNRIDVIVDTTRQLGFGQTTGSRGTLMTAGSVSEACAAALAAGCAPGVDYEGEYLVDWTQKLGDPNVANPTIHSCFSFATQMVVIDRETGNIDKVVAVHDVGKAVNPMLVEGQIEGSVHMGLGYALSEDFPTDPETGFPTNMTLRSLGILRAKDVPAMDVRIVEVPQPRSPFGIKGVGEIGLVPTAPAVAAALHDLDGEWRTSLPMRRTDDCRRQLRRPIHVCVAVSAPEPQIATQTMIWTGAACNGGAVWTRTGRRRGGSAGRCRSRRRDRQGCTARTCRG